MPFVGAEAVHAGLLTPAMLRGPAWRRLFHGVYLDRATEPDHRTWCAAAALRLPPDAAIGGLSAAHLWGAVTIPADAPVVVVVPRDRALRPEPRIAPHRTELEPADLTTVGGVPMTTAERTAFDVGRRCDLVDGVAVLDGLLHRGTVRLGELRAMSLRRYTWHGSNRLSSVIRLADGRAESPMETRLRLLFTGAGLPAPIPQFEVRAGDGPLIGRVDLGWPEARVAAEYDGDHHRDRAVFRKDVARLNALRMAGWTVLRFTADDVYRRPRETVAMLATLLQ